VRIDTGLPARARGLQKLLARLGLMPDEPDSAGERLTLAP
jgi:hypothetical protein